jgi:ABC-2 type transport system ATP-binding protein
VPRSMMASMMRSACASLMALIVPYRPDEASRPRNDRLVASSAGFFHISPRHARHLLVASPLASVGCAGHICASMSAPPPIAVERLVKIYKTVPAVDGISFTLKPGSITALLGGNGAGKTTTIATIMGLVTPTSGRVTVLGAEMPRQRYRVLQRMNFESPYVEVPMRLTVRQNMKVFGKLYGVNGLPARIEQLGRELNLTDLLDRPTGKLSSGQKTRVSLAKALINNPDVLLLDEPTASLDPDTADWVRGHLERYCRERHATVLLASHNMVEVERLCERVIIMKRGRIEDDDTPAKLLLRYGRRTLEEVFLDVARGRGVESEAAQ